MDESKIDMIKNPGEVLFRIMESDNELLEKVALVLLRNSRQDANPNDVLLLKALIRFFIDDEFINEYKLRTVYALATLATSKNADYPETALDFIHEMSLEKHGFSLCVDWLRYYGEFLTLDLTSQNASTSNVRKQMHFNKYNPTFEVLESALLADWAMSHEAEFNDILSLTCETASA